MAEFIDPASQAHLDKIVAALEGKKAELDRILAQAKESVGELGTVSREAAATQQAQARELSAAGRGAGAKKPAGAVPDAEALQTRIKLQEELNALIQKEIELRGVAAGEVRAEATAATAANADLVTQLEAMKRSGVGFQTAGSIQRVLNAMRTGEIGAGAGAPGALATPQAAAAAGATAKLSAEQQRLIASAEAGAAAESKLGAAAQRNVLLMAQASNEYQAHGALTTEFISAAARGQVTMREFGEQISQTIGKFAGWTAAAAAVYGALGAVQALGRGAVDANSGVQSLARFLPDLDRSLAGRQIGQTAQQLNVPVKDVTEAASAFARVTKNQTDVFTATRVAITATKLDNIALADSYRYLTALTQEFGLNFSQLPGLFDQVEAAQAKGGARVSELLPALAKSAAGVKNAQGDLNQLIALEATAIVRTGQTGNVVGTAFSRGAANFFRLPASQATFQRYGIDASKGYTQSLINAITKVSGGQFSGAQVQEISKAFFGPLRGGLLAGVFRSSDTLRQFGISTAPQNAAGQAQKELNVLLKQANEQIKQIGTNMEALGAALGQSGLLGPLGGFVKLLNTGLTTTTSILRAWNELPGIVKTVAGYAAGAFAVRAVTQRAGLTSAIPFLGRSPAATARQALTKGLEDERGYYQEQFAARARSAADATLAAQAAERTRNEAVAGGSQQQIIVEQRRYEAALLRQRDLEVERDVLAEQTLGLQERINAVTKDLNRGLTAQQAAAAAGIDYRLATLERGRVVTDAVVPVPRAAPGGIGVIGAPVRPGARGGAGGAVGAATAGGVLLPAGGKAAREFEDAARAEAQRAAAVQQAAAEQDRFGKAMGDAGTKVRGIASSIPGVTATIGAAAGAFGVARTATTGLVGKLGGWGGALLAFAVVAGQVDSANQSAGEATRELNRALDASADSFAQARSEALATQQAIKKKQDVESEGLLAGVPVLGGVAKALSGVPGFHQLNQLTGTYDVSNAAKQRSETLKAYNQAGEQQLKQVESGWSELEQSTQGRREMYARMDAARAKMKAFFGTSKEGQAAYHTFAVELQNFYNRFQAAGNVLPIDPNDIFRQFETQDLTTTATQLQGLGARAKTYGSSRAQIAQLAAGYQYVAQAYAGRTGSDSLQKIEGARQDFLTTVQDSVQRDLDAAKNARTPQAAGARIADARSLIGAAKADLATGEAQLKKRVDEAAAAWLAAVAAAGALSKQARDAFERFFNLKAQLGAVKKSDALTKQQLDQLGQSTLDTELSNIDTQTALRTSQIQGVTPEADIARKQSDVAGLRQKIAKARAEGASWQTIAGLQTQINNGVRDLLQSQNQSAASLLDAQNQLATSQIGGTSPEANIARAQSVLSGLRRVAALHQAQGADQTQAILDQVAINNQLQTIAGDAASNARAIAQAQGDLAKSQITGTSTAAIQARLRQDISTAASVMGADRASGAGQAALLQDQAAYNNALEALNQQIRTDNEQRAQAVFTLQESQTQDPVKRARIELAAARQTAANALRDSGKNSAQYTTAQANVNDKRQALKDQIIQGKENDVQFHLDMGQISVQTAIDEYRALLKMHNLTQAKRREILQQIHQWQTQGSSEFGALNLGSIRLPTPYEIRAGLLAAQKGQNPVAPHTNHFSVTINSEAGAHAFWTGADRHINGTGKSVQRAQGVR